ncbi:hypothetical protein ERJ75_000351300 [Trypanosoma vivax]|nr:hypothetical protein ERJ75_000351300 [Trypanosoma vivax]
MIRSSVLAAHLTCSPTFFSPARFSGSVGLEEKDTPQASAPARSEAADKVKYTIPTAEIIEAVRRRDFSAVQSHAVGFAHNKWKEEHNIPAACLGFTLLTWLFVSSGRRRIKRACLVTEAKVAEEAEQTLDLVNTLVRNWRHEVQRAEQQLQLILDKNSELTKDIDRMTAALRQCYPSAPTPKGA